jgi:hypothetical protein
MIDMSKTDMVRAYTEILLKQVTGIEEVEPDHDGDYPIRYESALYYVRIVPGMADDPVVQVFAVAVDKVGPAPALYEALNDINTKLKFARTFWVGGQVLFEAEMPGMSLSLDGFASACRTVASAADYFGSRLVEGFGGKTAFDNEKDPDYMSSESMWPGYL